MEYLFSENVLQYIFREGSIFLHISLVLLWVIILAIIFAVTQFSLAVSVCVFVCVVCAYACVCVQGSAAQEPILRSARSMLDSSTHLLKTARSLIINAKDPPTWSILAGHSRTVSDSIKSLITAIRSAQRPLLVKDLIGFTWLSPAGFRFALFESIAKTSAGHLLAVFSNWKSFQVNGLFKLRDCACFCHFAPDADGDTVSLFCHCVSVMGGSLFEGWAPAQGLNCWYCRKNRPFVVKAYL